MNRYLQETDISKWMTKIKITLIQKNPRKRNQIQQLQTHNVPTDDEKNTNGTNKRQKGCRKRTRGTGEQQYIGQ